MSRPPSAEQEFAGLGDNSYQEILLDAENVSRLVVYFRGSGAVGSLEFCPQPPDCPTPDGDGGEPDDGTEPDDGGDLGQCPLPNVDGAIGDWNLTEDFFAKLYEAGNPSKDHLADSYEDAWVKVYDLSSSTQVDGNSATFEWVGINGQVRGYEASFPLAAGSYAEIEIHLNVNGGDADHGGELPGRCGWRSVPG